MCSLPLGLMAYNLTEYLIPDLNPNEIIFTDEVIETKFPYSCLNRPFVSVKLIHDEHISLCAEKLWTFSP